MSHLDFPLHVDGRGRLAVTDPDDHVRDMIHQVLFTSPGERVNRPDFGCGLLQLVFLPNSEPLAIATEFTVKSALQRWLGDVIQTERVTVRTEEETLRVEVTYRRLLDRVRESATFERPIPA
ncbi:MAG: GPW/gp25 family protein [Actinobacteria bacterium]|jgi:phage baseplate assembly protein W|nr:GPW/gp25 family protein [Actinomycetota bacterium]